MLRRAFGNQRGEVVPGATLRTDAWWLLPATVFVVLAGFIVYSTWAALQNAHYYAAPYLSPSTRPACRSRACTRHSGPAAQHQRADHRDRLPALPDPLGPASSA